MKNRRLQVLILTGAVLCFFLGPALAQLKVEGGGENLFIRNATILTISNGTIEDGSVLVQGGKIKAVGKDVPEPPGCRVVDAQGGFVMPGIIDSHSHMGIHGNVNESTGQVMPQVNIQEVIRHDDIYFQRALAGGVTAINTLHGSANVFGGRNAVIKLKFGKPAEELFIPGAKELIKMALGENPKRSRMAGMGQAQFPSTRMGIEYTIRDAFTQAKEYMRAWDEYEKKRKGQIKKTQWEKKSGLVPPKRDLRLETLAGILKGELEIICHAYRADEMLMIMNVGDEMGFKVGSFEHCLEGYRIADEMAARGVVASIFADSWAYKMEAFEAIPYNAAIMIERGIIVTCNSDSPERVRRLYQDAAKLMKYGDVPELEALKTITLNPAIWLGIDDKVGTIEVGKDADLAIFNYHPFCVYTRCQMTIIEGDIYFDLAEADTVEKLVAKAEKSD